MMFGQKVIIIVVCTSAVTSVGAWSIENWADFWSGQAKVKPNIDPL